MLGVMGIYGSGAAFVDLISYHSLVSDYVGLWVGRGA